MNEQTEIRRLSPYEASLAKKVLGYLAKNGPSIRGQLLAMANADCGGSRTGEMVGKALDKVLAHLAGDRQIDSRGSALNPEYLIPQASSGDAIVEAVQAADKAVADIAAQAAEPIHIPEPADLTDFLPALAQAAHSRPADPEFQAAAEQFQPLPAGYRWAIVGDAGDIFDSIDELLAKLAVDRKVEAFLALHCGHGRLHSFSADSAIVGIIAREYETFSQTYRES